ncbi:MAG: MFS transporter [Chloroflexota bacterium]|nr:MFS transporter [Chloroflexota bacterium]
MNSSESGLRLRMMRRIRGLTRDPDFAKFWVSRTVSNFGALMGALQFVAVLVLHATSLQMGILSALGVAPSIVIGFLIGVVADRIRRRPILIAAELGRFVLLASIPVAYLVGLLRIEQLYAVAFFNGVLTTFFDVANRSYLPTLVRRSDLVDANSKLTASESFAEVTAFSIGGWIAQMANSVLVAAIGGLTFLVSALSLAFIRKQELTADITRQSGSVFREIASGLGVVWNDKLLRALAVANAAENWTVGMLSAVVLVFGVRELGFGPGALGTIFAIGGISSIIGASYAGWAARKFGFGAALVGGYAVYMLSILFIPAAREPLLLAGIMLTLAQLGDGFFTMFMVHESSLRQAITPDRSLGRMNATMRSLGLAALFAGSLVGGWIAVIIGLRLTIVVAASIGILGAVLLAVSPITSVNTIATDD